MHHQRPTSTSLPHIYSSSSSTHLHRLPPLQAQQPQTITEPPHTAPPFHHTQHPSIHSHPLPLQQQQQQGSSHRPSSDESNQSGGSGAITPDLYDDTHATRSSSYATTISEGVVSKEPLAQSSPQHTSTPVPVSVPLTPAPQPSLQPATATATADHAPMMRSSSNATLASSMLTTTTTTAAAASRKTGGRYALSDFALIRVIGTGTFGHVHLVRSCHNTRFYALKVLSKHKIVKMKQVEHTNSERAMLERVRHPFLVTLWGTFQCAANVYLVMDFVPGGELFSLLRRSHRFPDPVAKFFAAEVSLALDYLHAQHIIYRDLKPENILLGIDGHIKLADFGFAKYTPDVTWTLCGTPDYLAPEIIQNRAYNKTVDWYALGVLVFEMLAGYPPFYTEDPAPMRLYERILTGKVRFPPYFSPEVKDLLKRLLTSDITKRFGNMVNGSRDIFSHHWFAEVDWERLYHKRIPAPWIPRASGPGDSSCFERHPDVDATQYGQSGPDPFAHMFEHF